MGGFNRSSQHLSRDCDDTSEETFGSGWPGGVAIAWSSYRGSAKRLVDWGVLPATQLMPGATWLVPATALDTPAVRQGAQGVIARRPKNCENYQYDKAVRLPGL